MQMYVNDEQRDDLRAIARMTQDDLRGYAFAKIFPAMNVREKAGTVYVAGTNLGNAQGTAGRTDGTELSGTALATKAIAYATARVEGRAKIYENEMHGYSDMNAATEQGAIAAGRLALNKIENLAMAVAFSSDRKTGAIALPNHSVLATLQTNAKKVRAFGKPYLVMSDAALIKLCDIPEIRTRLEVLTHGTGDAGFLALTDEKVRAALSTMLGFYGIALFDSDIVTGLDTYIGIAGVRAETIGASADTVLGVAKSRAMGGATFISIPEGAQQDEPFTFSTAADRVAKVNYFDAEGWLVTKDFAAATASSGTVSDWGSVVVCKFATSYTEYGS